MTGSILLVDDNAETLKSLSLRLSETLNDEAVIVEWQPTEADGDMSVALNNRIGEDTVLVVTDYDLTTTVKGLFGLTIVSWCQKVFVPVGDFSRGNLTALPKEPNLFEMRIPTDHTAASYIANVFRGFRDIRALIEQNRPLLKEGASLAGVLAEVLDRPYLESQFAAYMSRLGAANSFLLQKLREFAGPTEPDDQEKIHILAYVLGHVLLNAILKYPGPILSLPGLAAYIATVPSEHDAIEEVFGPARYQGPFSALGPLYWRDHVDTILDELGQNTGNQTFDGFGDFNRHVVSGRIGRDLQTHQCQRCNGTKGGYWCPFTSRPVCEREDCSVAASSWIPQGAQLSRVEREFYDEWAPVLGM